MAPPVGPSTNEIEPQDLSNASILSDKLERATRRIERIGFTGADRVLDLGCGTGRFSMPLAKANGLVVSLDVRHDRLSTMRRLSEIEHAGNVRPVLGSIARLPFAANSFDLVFSFQSLNFVSDYVGLAEVARVLKPGGRFYINTLAWGTIAQRIFYWSWLRRNPKLILQGLLMSFNTFILEPVLRRRKESLYTVYYAGKYGRILRTLEGRYTLVSGADGELSCPAGVDVPVYPENPSFLGLPVSIEAFIEKVSEA